MTPTLPPSSSRRSGRHICLPLQTADTAVARHFRIDTLSRDTGILGTLTGIGKEDMKRFDDNLAKILVKPVARARLYRHLAELTKSAEDVRENVKMIIHTVKDMTEEGAKNLKNRFNGIDEALIDTFSNLALETTQNQVSKNIWNVKAFTIAFGITAAAAITGVGAVGIVLGMGGSAGAMAGIGAFSGLGTGLVIDKAPAVNYYSAQLAAEMESVIVKALDISSEQTNLQEMFQSPRMRALRILHRNIALPDKKQEEYKKLVALSKGETSLSAEEEQSLVVKYENLQNELEVEFRESAKELFEADEMIAALKANNPKDYSALLALSNGSLNNATEIKRIGDLLPRYENLIGFQKRALTLITIGGIDDNTDSENMTSLSHGLFPSLSDEQTHKMLAKYERKVVPVLLARELYELITEALGDETIFSNREYSQLSDVALGRMPLKGEETERRSITQQDHPNVRKYLNDIADKVITDIKMLVGKILRENDALLTQEEKSALSLIAIGKTPDDPSDDIRAPNLKKITDKYLLPLKDKTENANLAHKLLRRAELKDNVLTPEERQGLENITRGKTPGNSQQPIQKSDMKQIDQYLVRMGGKINKGKAIGSSKAADPAGAESSTAA